MSQLYFTSSIADVGDMWKIRLAIKKKNSFKKVIALSFNFLIGLSNFIYLFLHEILFIGSSKTGKAYW